LSSRPSLGLSDNAELPADPILARLLPDAYADDPDASSEFRRYTELSLRSGKVAAAQTVLETLPADGGRIRLSEPDAQAWLRALNDVRLALGSSWASPRTSTIRPTSCPRTTRAPPIPACISGWPTFRRASSRRSAESWLRSHHADDQCRLRAQILAHARADDPDEACGVIAGPAGQDRPERFIPMLNAARSPTFYEFDSLEQLRVWREMDKRDEEPVVIYHSHTATEAYPSRTDVALGPGARRALRPGVHPRSRRR